MKWSKEKTIAKGKLHTVYLASPKPRRHGSSGPTVLAVKSAEVPDSACLQKEAEVLSNLQGSHHIVGYYGEQTTFEDDGTMRYNILLEYASGGSLHDQILKVNGGRGLPEFDVRCYTKSLLRGLYHIHSRGYVHRDIKPMNILLVPSSSANKDVFNVKIADFGCAKKMEKEPRPRPIYGSSYAGTPLYLSPESINEYNQDAPADIWALGCVVAEMVSGKSVWNCESDIHVNDLLNKIGSGSISPQIPPGMSEKGQDFLQRCLVKKNKFRWTADMLLCHPFVAVDDSHTQPARKPSRIGPICQVYARPASKVF